MYAIRSYYVLKDLELFLKEAGGSGLGTDGPEGIRSILEDTIAQGLGEVDYSAVYERINPPVTSRKT